ncbi:MAG: YdeI/OmpD-associated family protein [Bacteroidota bacterium]
MPTKDKRVDAYIAKSADFAKPVMIHLRELIHKTCPEVVETIKWGMPSFEYKGPFCGFAAFKQHCAFGFWKASLMKEPALMESAKEETAMGHLGKITSLKDLPSDKKLISYLKEAMKLNDDGVKVVRVVKPKKEIAVPKYFTDALKKNKKAFSTFENFSPSCRREYLEWITEAKTEETRNKRMTQAIEWMAEGKQRNWKYMKGNK